MAAAQEAQKKLNHKLKIKEPFFGQQMEKALQFKEDIETSNALAIPGTIILEIGNELWGCHNHLVHCNHDHGSRPSRELKGDAWPGELRNAGWRLRSTT